LRRFTAACTTTSAGRGRRQRERRRRTMVEPQLGPEEEGTWGPHPDFFFYLGTAAGL
jgi:hypothetical protein